MATGKQGPDQVTVSIEDSPGGTARVITSHVRAINGVESEAILTRSDAFGDAWEKSTPTGKQKMAPIVLTMYWDNTATTGPAIVFATLDTGQGDAGRELILGYGDSKTDTVDVRFFKKRKLPNLDDLTGLEVHLQPTGTLVEA